MKNVKKEVYNNIKKEDYNNRIDKNEVRKAEQSYSYYSKLLKQPFDTIEELKAAEAKYYAEQKAKEDKAAQKKADAQKVEDAFKALNKARKDYKESLNALTKQYSEDLIELKKRFEAIRDEIKADLATAEDNYSAALTEFTKKHDQYHVTLRDGDFETTISGSRTPNLSKATKDVFDLFDWVFNF